MAIRHMDVLFVGMEKAAYIAAIEAIDPWMHNHGIETGRISMTYFDTGFGNAARLAANLPQLSAIFIANEVQMQAVVMQAACRKIAEILIDRSKKPLIVLDGSAIDAVDAFTEQGFNVDLKPDTGTVEEALKSLIVEKEKA